MFPSRYPSSRSPEIRNATETMLSNQLSYLSPPLARHKTPRALAAKSTHGGNIASRLLTRLMTGALFIPTNSVHPILKLPWAKSSLQLGRGPQVLTGNDFVLAEKRISNKHCRVTLGIPNSNSASCPVQSWKDGEGEPEVWLEDLGSSNGTFVGGRLACLTLG